MLVVVESRRGDKLAELTLEGTDTLRTVQEAFSRVGRRYEPTRQRFTLKDKQDGRGRAVALEHYKPLAEQGVTEGTVLVFRDMGFQVAWRTVYMIEYAGPLFAYPLFFLRPAFIYGADAANSSVHVVQWLALAAWTFHFLKRELETMFVHRWGPYATLPLRKIFENSGYYWLLGIAVSYFMNHPLYTAPRMPYVYAGLTLFFVAELCNLSAHLTLAGLRPDNTSRDRKIPYGALFSYISCPNYTFEILAWVGFNIMTWTVAGIVFNLFGAFVMTQWALQRHARYRREFANYPRRRRAICPFVL